MKNVILEQTQLFVPLKTPGGKYLQLVCFVVNVVDLLQRLQQSAKLAGVKSNSEHVHHIVTVQSGAAVQIMIALYIKLHSQASADGTRSRLIAGRPHTVSHSISSVSESPRSVAMTLAEYMHCKQQHN